MHPLHRYILANNNADWGAFLPLYLAGQSLGRVHRELAEVLLENRRLKREGNALCLTDEAADIDGRSRQLRDILLFLVEKKLMPRERKELYPVAASHNAPHVALADRALMPVLGFLSYGIHCNGFVRGLGAQGLRDSKFESLSPLAPEPPSPFLKLWIARRALDSATDPGKLDHLVAGGQPYGISLIDNLAKEGFEEAGIPKELTKTATPVGSLTYSRQHKQTLRRDTLFMFDLELPASFTPQNQDGEVLDFQLLPAEEVLRLLKEGDHFKFNVPLVLIDFFLRQGYLNEGEPGMTELKAGLQGRHFPLPPGGD